MRHACLYLLLIALGACTGNPDGTPNVLPDWVATPDAADPGDLTLADAANLEDLPAQYRFTTVNIQQLGSEGEGGFLTLFLQLQWEADINGFKWNQVFSLGPSEAGGTEVGVQVLSAIGSDNENLCSLGDVNSDVDTTTFEDGGVAFEFDRINIYTEDDEGNPFNCSADTTVGNMIPLQGISGTLSVSADWETVTGEFIGCLTEAHTLSLCSCIGDCVPGNAHPGCPGCPEGSAPLKESLGNIVITDTCTNLLGEPAFDLRATFVAKRLPSLISDCE